MQALGVQVLADHGDAGDVPVLLAALRCALDAESWCAAEAPARGLGRLHAADAVDDLVVAWESTAHSLAREAFLEGLQGCAGDRADSFTVEGLYDCEPSVQQLACRTAAATAPRSGRGSASCPTTRWPPMFTRRRMPASRRSSGRGLSRPRVRHGERGEAGSGARR